jgi:hypothetical protein
LSGSIPRLFNNWTDEQLQEAARIIDAAGGEGVYDDEIAGKLCNEAAERRVELPMGAWHDHMANSIDWFSNQRARRVSSP